MRKTYEIAWYKGNVEGTVNWYYRIKLVKAKDINKTLKKYKKVLPKNLQRKILYSRIIMHSDKFYAIDYGSYHDFIYIKEI